MHFLDTSISVGSLDTEASSPFVDGYATQDYILRGPYVLMARNWYPWVTEDRTYIRYDHRDTDPFKLGYLPTSTTDRTRVYMDLDTSIRYSGSGNYTDLPERSFASFLKNPQHDETFREWVPYIENRRAEYRPVGGVVEQQYRLYLENDARHSRPGGFPSATPPQGEAEYSFGKTVTRRIDADESWAYLASSGLRVLPIFDSRPVGNSLLWERVYENARLDQLGSKVTDRIWNLTDDVDLVYNTTTLSTNFAVVLFGVTAMAVRVITRDSSNVVQSRVSIDVPSNGIVIAKDLTIRNQGKLEITFHYSNDYRVGFESILFGELVEVGTTEKPAKYSLINYSQVQYNNGETTIEPGSTIDRGDFSIKQRNIDYAYEIYTKIAALPHETTLWMPDIGNSNTWVRGYRREFDLTVTNDHYASLNLTVLGLLGD